MQGVQHSHGGVLSSQGFLRLPVTSPKVLQGPKQKRKREGQGK